MKYIDADRLIAYLEEEANIEFKKTEENANSPVLCHFHNGCRMMALETIDFIKQHQQEQPEVDFKIEERKWIHNAVDNVFPEDGDFMSEVDFRKILKDTARHFYEFGELNARKEENK